jgi:hypothetical protein
MAREPMPPDHVPLWLRPNRHREASRQNMPGTHLYEREFKRPVIL